MFWKLTSLSASSPVESLLDKEKFTLEELLDEEEIIQECKALNSRLIKFLRDRAQVEELLCYIIEDPPEGAEIKRTFKFPFIACEIFTCEIDVILKTLVEDEELMNLLFSFLEPNRPHSALLAGYFSKVVVCLMMRKTVPLMNYVQAHQDVFRQLVDLIGITSIMEVLVRLVGADDHVYPNFLDVMQWLADSNVLEMIVDKLSPSSLPEVHANAAETLCAITRNYPSALANKLSSPSFVARIFDHALEDSCSKSGLVHSLSVCISLLDPRSAVASGLMHSFRSQNFYEPPIPVNPDTINAMLPKLSDLLRLLNVSSDENILPTTYGELRPPLGKYRLKIVEFIAVLLRTGNEAAEKDLVSSGIVQRVLDLFFEYPYNNALHHHVESIIVSCLETKNDTMVDHLLQACDMIGKILQADKHPTISDNSNQPTLPATGKRALRAGNLGHIARISNKLVQLGSSNSRIQEYLQGNSEWLEWQTTVLHERNAIENVYRWACGRPTALQDRRDSDEDDLHDRDYDVAALANNLSQAFRYKIYENEDAEVDHGALDRDDEDVYFDDESAEVVISSLRLGDDKGSSLFTNSDWFAYQDDRMGDAPVSTSPSETMDDINLNGNANGGDSSSDDEVVVGEDDELTENKDCDAPVSTSPSEMMDDINLNGNANGGNSSSDDEVVVGEDDELTESKDSSNGTSTSSINLNGNANGGNSSSDDEVVVGEDDELTESKDSSNGTSTSSANFLNGFPGSGLASIGDLNPQIENVNASQEKGGFFRFETPENEDFFGDRPLPEWVGWGESSDLQVGGSGVNPFEDHGNPDHSHKVEAVAPDVSSPSSGESSLPNGSPTSTGSSDGSGSSDSCQKSVAVPSLFEEDVEFVGVELEGTEKAMEQALKEGIVGEAGPLKREMILKVPGKDNPDDGGAGIKEFNDANYWRVDQ